MACNATKLYENAASPTAEMTDAFVRGNAWKDQEADVNEESAYTRCVCGRTAIKGREMDCRHPEASADADVNERPQQPHLARSDTVAGDLLLEAAEIVEGDRNRIHGRDKERSFNTIATMWNTYLGLPDGFGRALTAADVAVMMVLMKIARTQHGEPVRDHYLDMAGYAAIAWEVTGGS